MSFIDHYLFPHFCCLCQEKSDCSRDLCAVCRHSLPWKEAGCYQCGALQEGTGEPIRCDACETNPPPFDRLCALFDYQPPITRLITGLKFRGRFAQGRLLGELLLEALRERWYQRELLPEALIPMPLHPKRLRQRGYNQAAELCRPLKQQLDLLLRHYACLRRYASKPQSGLTRAQRLRNISPDAFEITQPLPFQHVAILDDVVTTGRTVKALAAALKAAGVEQVDVWCVARA